MTDVCRCHWPGTDPLYCAYHDTEWGVPEYDSRALWEKLVLDGFQAGLSWITILRKRDALRNAFAGFDPEIVARFNEADVERLLQDTGIIRSRAKITAAIDSARITLDLREAGVDFKDFIWGIQDHTPQVNHFRKGEVPAETKTSQDLAKLLKSRGYKFCGPVIVYAFMQAVGMVNDHVVECFRHGEVAEMMKRA